MVPFRIPSKTRAHPSSSTSHTVSIFGRAVQNNYLFSDNYCSRDFHGGGDGLFIEGCVAGISLSGRRELRHACNSAVCGQTLKKMERDCPEEEL